MTHIDAEHLAVFEFIQHLAPGRIFARRFGTRTRREQRSFEFKLQLPARFGAVERVGVADHREQVGVLHAHEIVPQEIADAQDLRQVVEHLGVFQRSQFVGPVGPFEEMRQELAEVQQRLGRVGRTRQEMREMFDQHRRRAQLALFLRRSDLHPVFIGDVQQVVGAFAAGMHHHARNIGVRHRKRIGELVQKAHRIGGLDMQHGMARGNFVVDLDLDRVQAQVGAAHALENVAHTLGQLAARLAPFTGMHHARQRAQVFGVLLPIGGLGVDRFDGEDVHDFTAGGQRRRFCCFRQDQFPGAGAARTAGRREIGLSCGFFHRFVGEDLRVLDIQPMREHQPADQRKFAQVVVAHHRHPPTRPDLDGIDKDKLFIV